jgi:hypothetical protein
MVILAGIEMEDSANPPRLWTAIEDAYGALSDALGTDGDTTADEEEAKATGRHFVIPSPGDAEELRKALMKCQEITLQWQADERLGVAGSIEKPEARSASEALIDIEFVANAALDAPPRNCDRFATLPDALAAWRDIDPREAGPFDTWLFALATEQEGGAK